MEEWMNNPALKDLDPIKLEMMKTALKQTHGKSGREVATILMALITSAAKRGIRFTAQETRLILDLMKEGKTPEEKDHLDQMFQMALHLVENGGK